MNRFPSRSIPTISRLSPTCRRSARPTHTFQAAILSAVRTYSNGKTSAPKSAERASANSGGSRSNEAKETGSSPTAGAIPDPLAEGDVRGVTGGGKPLNSSRDPPPQPTISNSSMPGTQPKLTPEQQAEVDEHNRDFEKKHGKAQPAADDKVDKSFWSGKGSRYNKD
ncbi:hypothetical protein C8A03DRAFT_46809 [Achaetomium macrosporum]|uniref:Uncharacterized protein n=1 Tax=Achaetomium macrosporum TaxID=79813 RepID=A0AAN7C429_9PEZI|nr:hypothetical protein C8A03DRAFT_46809 [Achaetomium macrosporum]